MMTFNSYCVLFNRGEAHTLCNDDEEKSDTLEMTTNS